MLYRPEQYEPLTDEAWNGARARDAILTIVADADAAYRGPKLMWRAHAWDCWHGTSPMKNLYVGVAGVLWALDELRARGLAETSLDLADVALRNLENFRERPDYMKGMKLPEPRGSSLLSGEAGILLTTYRLTQSDEIADTLHESVRANRDNEAEEVMWGSPGTLIAARLMLDWTGDPRWSDAWNESADALWARRDDDGFWVQRLHGQDFRGLTPLHGLVGNVQALLPRLDVRRKKSLRRDSAELLRRTAIRDDGLANWPYYERPHLESPDGQIRMQWCTGAPGVVACAADYLDEDLLLAGAELAWHAGPPTLEKGPGICHGSAGTGHTFLKVFERTGDERWLDRARRFGMHALGQVERLRAERGTGRYSLWTGDVGVGLFVSDCLEGRSRYPLLDE